MKEIKVTNYDEKLMQKIEKREKTMLCLTIASLFVALSGVACMIASFFLAEYENFLLIFGGALLIAAFVAGLILKEIMAFDSRWGKARKYHSFIKNKTLINICYSVDKHNRCCYVEFVAENDNHCISRIEIEFPVVEKTDIEDVVLDMTEERVYIPYDKTKEEEK